MEYLRDVDATNCELLSEVMKRVCLAGRAETITRWLRRIRLWLHSVRLLVSRGESN